MINIKNITEKTKMSCGKFQEVDYDLSRFINMSPNQILRLLLINSVTIKSTTRGNPEFVSFKIFPEGIIIESKR